VVWQVINTGGIGGNPTALVMCASAWDAAAGRGMQLYTNAPGVQLYHLRVISTPTEILT
jgi:hypothetical protein